MSQITDRARLLLNQHHTYRRGCSGFVTSVYQIPYRTANSLMGPNPEMVGVKGHYKNIVPGNVVGWKTPNGHGHVGIYIGKQKGRSQFIDVHSENEKPRIVHSYGNHPLYKSSYSFPRKVQIFSRRKKPP
ncbi:MAG TPA: hypothetical protein VMG59_09915 [Phycisphaerae bacterium]|nr:hypothetical protein [Phycisphaerae bacterium]